MIKIQNVHKSFDQLQVLKGIDLEIQKGEFLSVVGSSGSGKSTLLYCTNGLEPIQQGNIWVDGTDVHAKTTDIDKLRQKMGMVFQQFNCFPHLTALENIILALKVVLKQPHKVAVENAHYQLEKVGLIEKINQYPNSLSGGQQQRLAIARALAMKPTYMLLDEITSALDPELVGEVLDTLRGLRDEGMTMVCVTHEIGFAREISDRVAFFHQGLIAEIGPAKQLIDNPKEKTTQKFLSKVL